MSDTKFSVKHFVSLDVAVAAGLDFEHDGKTWTFSPLRFRDLGAIIAKGKSLAVQAYMEAAEETGVTPMQRARDMNAILFGSAGQLMLTCLDDPIVRHAWLKRSLAYKHPDITDEQVDMFLDDDAVADEVIDLVEMMTAGDSSGKEKKEAENPTATAQ